MSELRFTRARSFADVKVGELVVKKELTSLLVLECTARGWRRKLLVSPSLEAEIPIRTEDLLKSRIIQLPASTIKWEQPVRKRRLVECLLTMADNTRTAHYASIFRGMARAINRGTYQW